MIGERSHILDHMVLAALHGMTENQAIMKKHTVVRDIIIGVVEGDIRLQV